MLNESRIKLMTKMAAYESNEGKKNMAIGTFFHGDYISKEVIKSIIYGTVAYFVVVALYVVYDFEKFMTDIYNMDLMQFGKVLLKRYLILIVVYSVITAIVYAVRHRKARKNLRIYYNNLRRLNSMYRKESRTDDI
ncbi:MAG: hypothetical protein BWY61_00932 [Firmicutes bacterium ADurb.Bin354]|nr:MAG: hypothetical protein BWY61_00932 [Firmicutes bacterium ADurb.Bin354]SCX78866.1 hypothetical protein SAMN02910370_00144 [Lachnospiraceae bacterium XPB1003]